MVAKFFITFLKGSKGNKLKMAVAKKCLWDSRVIEFYSGLGCREDADLILLLTFAVKDNTKSNNDKKGKGEIPAKGGLIPEELKVPGLEHDPYTLEAHFCSIPQLPAGKMQKNILQVGIMDYQFGKVDSNDH